MKLNEFVEEFNFAPMSLEEFAEIASDIVDNAALAQAADEYLAAQANFKGALEYHNVHIG